MCLLSRQGYFEFLQNAEVFSFLSQGEIEFIKSTIQMPNQTSDDPELTCHEGSQPADGSSDTYWPMQSELDAPGLDMGWPVPQPGFMGPTEVTTLVNPSDPDMPSIKEQARRLIKNARQVSRTEGKQAFNLHILFAFHWYYWEKQHLHLKIRALHSHKHTVILCTARNLRCMLCF